MDILKARSCLWAHDIAYEEFDPVLGFQAQQSTVFGGVTAGVKTLVQVEH